MMRATANGLEQNYDVAGKVYALPVLLIRGLGTQMTRWPATLIDGLVAHGLRVIRFDNRDVGLSTKLDHLGAPDLVAMRAALLGGTPAPVPYMLSDMAHDAIALLDALHIPAAHIVGISMGGMIGQIIAARYPERTLSLTSVMSSSGNPALPRPSDAVLAMLARPRPASGDVDALLCHAVEEAQLLAGRHYCPPSKTFAATIAADVARCHHPASVARQTAAIAAAGDRRPLLATIRCPVLVVHGTNDPLIDIAAERDTAAHVPGARMLEFAGMGRDLPDALMPTLADAIADLAATAGPDRSGTAQPAG